MFYSKYFPLAFSYFFDNKNSVIKNIFVLRSNPFIEQFISSCFEVMVNKAVLHRSK